MKQRQKAASRRGRNPPPAPAGDDTRGSGVSDASTGSPAVTVQPDGESLRVGLRVRPGASRTKVGGLYGNDLVVAVAARAVDGRATQAALEALAEALGLRRYQVELASGATSRSKVALVVAPGQRDRVCARLAELSR